MEASKNGIFYMIGTPIGNLEDLSFRALRILKEVNLILCENLKNSKKLFNHYQIETPAQTYYFGGDSSSEWVKAKLLAGENIAFISDSGTPGVSDPGAVLVKYLRKFDIQIVPIPGPSALTSILSVSGAMVNPCIFLGFLPDKESKKRRELEPFRNTDCVLVVYESVHRIENCLVLLSEVFPEAQILVGRELTKIHEEIFLYSNSSSKIVKKGEFVILINNQMKKISKEKRYNTDTLIEGR
jgi:16S rRNA (cytidine1402-2'-O)-methyltransferase